MKANKCVKCNIRPDILQAGGLTVVKCMMCGQAVSRLLNKRSAVEEWNEYNRLTTPKGTQ